MQLNLFFGVQQLAFAGGLFQFHRLELQTLYILLVCLIWVVHRNYRNSFIHN